MNVSRLVSMTRKDVVLVTRESFFLFMIIMPILMTLALNAALGSVGTAKPTVAVYGGSAFVPLLEEEPSIELTIVLSEQELRDKVLQGEYDAGLIFEGSDPESLPTLVISGKSLLNDRITIGATLANAYRKYLDIENAVTFDTRIVGTEEFSLKIRLIPFLLIIATVVAGLIISSSLIEEREKKTLNAVLVTPITPLEVVMAKSLFGLFLGLILGILILALNGSFTGGIYLILFFLILGTLFTVALGLMAGVVMENITDLIARMKLFNLFLMFPAFIVLFPQIPQWLGRFFPTYYFIDPILAITQKGAVWSDVWWEAVILVIIDAVGLVLASRVLRERMLGRKVGRL
jgi:ABC-2 type transport system permease protein